MDAFHEIRDLSRDQQDERIREAVAKCDHDFLIRIVWNLTRARSTQFLRSRGLGLRNLDEAFACAVVGVWKAAVRFDGSTWWPSFARVGAEYELKNWITALRRKKRQPMSPLSDAIAERLTKHKTSRYFVY